MIDTYDKLIIATGASTNTPDIKGIDKSNVFTLRNILDMNNISEYIKKNNPKKATIIGTGFNVYNLSGGNKQFTKSKK